MAILAILGASGHGKVVADAAKLTNKWKKIVFYDDRWPTLASIGLYDVVGDTSTLLALADKPDFIVAIGDNKIRLDKQLLLENSGFSPAIVQHPKAVIAEDCSIGAGTVVMAGAVINASARIGAAVIINSNAVVEHDCILADGVHVSPGACLAGAVQVGQYSWVGIGASVRQLIVIGNNVIVGAGAVVVSDVSDNQKVAGVPARLLS